MKLYCYAFRTDRPDTTCGALLGETTERVLSFPVVISDRSGDFEKIFPPPRVTKCCRRCGRWSVFVPMRHSEIAR